jgi:hypothetical protein
MPAVRRHLPTGWDYVGGLEASPGLRDENFFVQNVRSAAKMRTVSV